MSSVVVTGNIPRRGASDLQMDSRRFWMDEEEDEGIFSVFLKRIRRNSGQRLPPSDTPNSVAYLEWQTVKVRVIKAGTVKRILKCLITEDNELDLGSANIFFDTYREFSNTEEIIEKLLQILSESYATPAEFPVRHLVGLLLDNYPEDFMAAGRAELDDSIMMIMEHAERHADLQLKNELVERISIMNATSYPAYLEILDWIQNSPTIASDESVECVTAEDLLNYSDKQIAEQLTNVDAVLLKRLLPHECLPKQRSRSTSKKILDTVQATILHFNAVCTRVQSTLLDDVSMSPSLRLRLLIKWIDIAQFLLVLKNFSSLKAVISALESEPVFRLEKLWASLPSDKLMRFRELAGVFSTDRASPQTLRCQKLGSSSSEQNFMTVTTETTTLKIARRTGHRRSHSDNSGNIHGMIPYLGRFLTDLVMLDTALPDFMSHSKSGQRFNNFEKRRKEFEILAQIRLFQSAAAMYQIEPHDHFRFWFYKSLRVLHVEDCFSNSFLVEPPTGMARSISEVSENSTSSDGRRKSALKSGFSTLKRMLSQENLLANAPLVVARKNSISSSQSLDYRRAISTGENQPKSPYLSDTFCILKISMDCSGSASIFYGGVNMYKSILVNDCEKTPAVIKSALEKHDTHYEDPGQYDLVQLLSNNEEFVIPPEATVFYAMNSGEQDLKFKLRKRTTSLNFLSALPKRSSSASRNRNPTDALKKWSIKTVTVTRN